MSKKPVHPRIAMMNAAKAAKRLAAQAQVERKQPPLRVRQPGTDPGSKALNAVERAALRRQTELGKGYGPMEPYDDGTVEDDGAPLRGAPAGLGRQEQPRGLGAMHKTPPRSTVGRASPPGTQEREVLYGANGRVMVRGRDGKMLTRTNVGSSDKFYIPPEIVPDGWSYQGIAVSVYGQPQSTLGFLNNGWTPVPASRHDGMFMPIGHDGPIIIDGQMIVERPIELTLEARDEEIAAARNLIRTQNEQFTPRLPDARRHPGTQMRARRTIEGLPPDVPQPQYRYGVDDGA
jgi:hypothetical protein